MGNKKKSGAGKAIVLLSGGLDSAVTLYLAKKQRFKVSCLIFDYGQRHRRELDSAKRIARSAGCKAELIKIALPWKGSSLLDKKITVPFKGASTTGEQRGKIPSTYVPGRNIIFLSFALSCAEAKGAEAIFIGAHIQDYSGYPDCRPEFYRAFKKVIATGTRSGIKKNKIEIKTPLIKKNKSQIIQLGAKLGVPFALTWSCYMGGERPCEKCDSCYYRAKGFKEAGMDDSLIR